MKAKALIIAAGTALIVSTGWAQQSGRDGMPVLAGALWQQMSQGEKVAFLWGAAHVVDFERNVRAKAGSAPGKTLIPHMEESLKGRSFRSLVDAIDAYYAGASGRRDRPVLNVLVTETK